MKSVSILKELAAEQPDLNILYVEDDTSLRENTLRLMSSFFNNVDHAVNGQEGLEKFESGTYDIVISDLRMPIMDGIEMVRRIKTLNNDQLVIITSAHDETDYLLKLISMGVESFILKPLDVEQFMRVLIKTLHTVRLRQLEIDYKNQLEETVRLRTEELSEANTKLEDYALTLEQKVTMRTTELHESLTEVERANKKVMDSIEYARRIQGSLLPNTAEIKQHLPNHFLIWVPRDIVGGDLYHLDFSEENIIICLLDCTGHGVPGALMTMLASSGLRRIIQDENQRDPAEILKRLNVIIKTSLQQDTAHASSDDGLEAAVCQVDLKEKTLCFSGAKQPLIAINNGHSELIKGDRVSIGYKNSDLDHEFTRHTLPLEPGMRFYLYSDGFVDQIGGEKRVSFGKSRLRRLLEENHQRPFGEQKSCLLDAFKAFKGNNETRDDYTLLGFALD